jgi:hypothetical protein
MTFKCWKTLLLASALTTGTVAISSGPADAAWRHYYRHGWHRVWYHAHYVPHYYRYTPRIAVSSPPPVGLGYNGGYGNCIKRDPVWTSRGWRSDWVIDCAGKGAGYGGVGYTGYTPGGYYYRAGYGYSPGYYGGWGWGGGGLLGALLPF